MSQLFSFASAMKLLAFVVFAQTATAWTSQPDGPRRRAASAQRTPVTKYVPSITPATDSSSTTAQNMLKTPGFTTSPRKSVKLSQSVLADCDTLPSFRTAHGILSPETVRRMEQLVEEGDRSVALKQFLERYRRLGPMSCLPMLSDPDVLPHLTNAMRNVLE